MQLTIPKTVLDLVVSRALRGVSGRSVMPVQNNILLEASQGSDGLLSATGTDLESIGIEVRRPCDVAEPGQVTAPGKLLAEIVRALPDGDVSLSHAPAENGASGPLVIRAGRSRFELRTMDARDYQSFPPCAEDALRFELPQPLLKRALGEVTCCASKDKTRPMLTGVAWMVAGSRLTLVATDAYRLCRVSVPLEEDLGEQPTAVVDAEALGELRALLSDDGDLMVTIRLSPNQVRFELDDCTLSSRLIEGQYPNYQKVIPDEQDRAIEVSCERLRVALKRVLLIGREDARRVALNPQQGLLRVSSQAQDIGEAGDEMDCTLEGDPLEFGVNGRLLDDFLQSATADTIRIEMQGPNNPCVLSQPGREDWLGIVMPMMVA